MLDFGADMSSSVHIIHKNKDNLITRERSTHGLDDIKLTAKQNILLILHNQENKLY